MSLPTYDFIVVGGGTAGLVLANRLTANPSTHVLVLEAGGNALSDPRVQMPGGASALYDNDEFDWQFRSVPQPHLDNKIITYPRGKTLGGSSAINILGLVYPNASSIDAWGRLGNSGWSWDDLVPYYRKFQTYNAPTEASREALGIDYVDEAIQGRDGPIQSSYPKFVGPLVKAWPETLKNLGWPITGDPMSGRSIGGFSGPYTVNPKGTVRSHAGNEYYEPIQGRANLRVETGAFAEKIVFDSEAGGEPVATGIQYTVNGERKTAAASKEVILAAGVFQTPQLLELSGIGGRTLLEGLSIGVVVDNPHVGENLQDHAMSGLCAQVREGVPTGDLRRDAAFLAKAKDMYVKDKTGPLTAGFPSFAFLPVSGWADDQGFESAVQSKLHAHPPEDTRPSRDEQAAILRSIVLSKEEASTQLCLGASQVHFDKSTYGEVFAVTEPENYVAILVSLPHPFSAGTVHVSSADPKVLPTVDPRFMSHPLDPEVLGRHMSAVEKLFETEPLASLIEPAGRRLPASSPLADAEKVKSARKNAGDEWLLDAGRKHASTYVRSTSHPVGTAAMLPREKGGVVDEKLNLYGVNGLRIVDASVFPMVVRGNIQSTVYAVAERAADFVKEKWGL